MLNSGLRILTDGANLPRLLDGLLVTAQIAFASLLSGLLLGIVLGMLRAVQSRPLQFLLRLYLELFRIVPILVWLFLIYFGVAAWLNIHLDGIVVALIVFSLWGAAEMSDLVRAALDSLPQHQRESAKALGLSFWQMYRHILLPQAVRRLLPGAMNLATRMVKTTSLLVIIGVVDVVKVAQQIIERSALKEPSASFWIYGFLFILYFMICYPLSRLSATLENKYRG